MHACTHTRHTGGMSTSPTVTVTVTSSTGPSPTTTAHVCVLYSCTASCNWRRRVRLPTTDTLVLQSGLQSDTWHSPPLHSLNDVDMDVSWKHMDCTSTHCLHAINCHRRIYSFADTNPQHTTVQYQFYSILRPTLSMGTLRVVSVIDKGKYSQLETCSSSHKPPQCLGPSTTPLMHLHTGRTAQGPGWRNGSRL